MAAALSITGFHDAVTYKIVKCTGITDTTNQVNVTGSSGTLYAAYLDSANCTANVSLHILDPQRTTNTEFVVRGIGSSTSSLQIPTGFAFDQLNFYVSANSIENDNTSFSGTVAVTLVCT
jgi:hypothetical protein